MGSFTQSIVNRAVDSEKIASLNGEGKVPVTQLPASQGGITLSDVKADAAIAAALSNSHAPGSDNQDISGKVDKATGYSLVSDSEISKIHSSGSDNQDLSSLVVKVTGSSLVADTEIAKIHASGSDNQDLSGLEPKQAGKSLSANDLTAGLKTSYDGAVTHAGSAHAPSNAQKNSDVTKAEIEAKLTGEISSHSHASAGVMTTLRTASNQTINGGAATFVDITGLTFAVANGTSYAFHFYITFQSAASTTGWKAGVNCPNGTLDFWCKGQNIANGAAGVATHVERHNTVRDDMTLLTATITQAVDLNVQIEGRYLCTQDGTFAARFANELATDTNIVVQKGSWGWWF